MYINSDLAGFLYVFVVVNLARKPLTGYVLLVKVDLFNDYFQTQ